MKAMKRQSSSNSNLSGQHERSRCKEPISEGEMNLHHYLHKMGLPSGLHSAIESIYHSMESRIWIVDNSLDMNVSDASLLRANDQLTCIGREGGASRWGEQMQCVDFHMKMAGRAWIPTKVSSDAALYVSSYMSCTDVHILCFC